MNRFSKKKNKKNSDTSKVSTNTDTVLKYLFFM